MSISRVDAGKCRGIQGDSGGCSGDEGDAMGCRGMQGDAVGMQMQGDAGGQASSSQGRLEQTIAVQGRHGRPKHCDIRGATSISDAFFNVIIRF